MAFTKKTGTSATTGNSTFTIHMYTEPVYSASNYKVKFYYEIEVTKGNFQNTTLSVSWGSSISVTLNGVGIAHKSATYETSAINYGKVKAISGSATYTGGSGTKYTASVSYDGYPTMKVYDGSNWKNAIPWVYNGTEWKKAIPMVYDGNKWVSGPVTQ